MSCELLRSDMTRILIVEPNDCNRSWLRTQLVAEGFEASAAATATASLEELQLRPAAMVITEWVLPDASRGSWIERLRSHSGALSVGVLVLARDTDGRVAADALDQGADDFLGKPAHGRELMARLRAVLRRQPAAALNNRFRVGPVCLEKLAHRITVNGQTIDLAPAAYGLMAYFLEHPGRVFDRKHLLERVWGRRRGIGVRTVDVHVRRLRAQLEPHQCADLLQTVRGFGYRFGS